MHGIGGKSGKLDSQVPVWDPSMGKLSTTQGTAMMSTGGGSTSSKGPGPGWGPVRVGALSGLGPIWALMGPYMGPYEPLWAHIWAHMGPYGSSWTGLGKGVNFPSDFRQTFGPISHVSGPKMVF